MFLWFAAAYAASTFTIARPDAKPLEPLGPAPEKGAELKEWTRELYERADQADLDAALARRTDLIGACTGDVAADNGGVTVKVTVGEDGILKKVEASGGNAAVGVCAQRAWSGLQLPIVRHATGHATYTLTLAPGEATPPTHALDRETGFGALPWGVNSGAIESLEYHSDASGTQLYGRASDERGRWMGVPLSGATYGFADDKLYLVTLNVRGTAQSYDLRQALTALYGTPKWDIAYNAWYWRGERVLLQATPVKGTDVLLITLLDIAGATAHGLADRLPGDRADPASVDTSRRLPKIYKDDAAAPVTPTP